jgi:flagellar basal-body rod protein FlgB
MVNELERALDALVVRQRTVANNLANINTPGFTRSDVDFFSHMQAVFQGLDVAPEAVDDTLSPERMDGNNVSLEREMFALSQTELLYNAVSRFTADDLERLRYVCTDGRG